MQANKLISPLLLVAFLCALSFAALAGVTPSQQPVPSIDSSVFLYVGDSILEGQLPYRDVWDHKSPAIYYIDAAGLALAGGSRWGVWLLEFVSLFIALVLLCLLMRRVAGRWPALIAVAAFVLGLQSVLHGGNFTEEYALPLQLGSLLLFFDQLERPARWKLALIGVLAALCFLLRPNLIGVSAVIAGYYAYLALRSRPSRADLFAILAGALAVIALVSVYFWSQASLAAMWDAMLRYNLAYTFLRQGTRLNSLGAGVLLLWPVLLLAAAGWLVALVNILRHGLLVPAGMRPFFVVLLVCLPLEMILTGLPGRDYQHYFMSWLPVAAVFAGFAVYALIASLHVRPLGAPAVYTVVLVVISLFVFIGASKDAQTVIASAWAQRGLPQVDLSQTPYQPSLEYIYDNTAEDSYLLFWGNNLALHWITDRPAPTRFIYQSPLGVPGYVSDALVQELLADLTANPPLIIDTTINDDPLPGLDHDLATLPSVLRPLYEYIRRHYQQEATLFRTDWTVYRYVGDATSN